MLRALASLVYRYSVRHWREQRRFPTVQFDPSVEWRGNGSIQAGRDVHVGSGSVVAAGADAILRLCDGVWLGRDCEISAGTRIEVGERTSLQHRTQLHGDVSIGAGCVGAANLYVSSAEHEFRQTPALPIRVQDFHRVRRPPGARSRPVVIGDDCWLGINVVVLPGVAIGRGCIVGANSVVTRDLAPYTIAVGSPARPVGKRLPFVPPTRLDSGDDALIPYFYAGFSQLGRSEAQDNSPRRVRGGWAAHAEFTVALAAGPSDGFELEVDALVACRITHGDIEHVVPAGRSAVRFVAVPRADGLLNFRHSAASPPDTLVVTRAQLSDTTPV